MAKLLHPGGQVLETVTAAEHAGGTLPYMAPEQLRGESTDSRCDVYAAGAVLYELATGRRPFPATAAAQLIEDIAHKDPERPTALNAALSPGFEAIILKCLAKHPERRYSASRELALELRRLAGVATPAAPPRQVAAASRHLFGLAVIGSVGALLVAAGVSGVLRDLLGRPSRAASLAVLPLANLSGDPEQEYFADGMTEAVISELSKIRSLKVISRTSAMQYKRSAKPVPRIARELGVSSIIEGSVLREGDRVRVMVQLIDGRSDVHLWSESYDREMRGILSLQSEVARAIAGEIRTTLTPQEKARLSRARPVDPAAHEAYLRGISYVRQTTPDSLLKGLEHLERARSLDPGDPLVYAALADAYFTLGNFSMLRPQDAYPKSQAAAAQALALDDTLAEAHFALAVVKHYYEWDQPGAEREYLRAFELSPGFAYGRAYHAEQLVQRGRGEEAIAEAERAREMDPLSIVTNVMGGIALHYSRRYDRALEAYRTTLERYPDDWLTSFQLSRLQLAMGKFDEAIPGIERQIALYPGDVATDSRALLGIAHALAGRRSGALKILGELLERRRRGYLRPVILVEAHATLGNTKEALEWLEKGYEEKDDWMVWIKCDPFLDGLRHEPRMREVQRKVGLD